MYVTARAGERWEFREAHSTDRGPRNRTLASFRVLTPDIVELVRARAGETASAQEVRRIARRAGAPVADGTADAAAASLLNELAEGRRPRGAAARLLADALGDQAGDVSDAERAVARWIGVPPAERGEALRDVLLLADALPVKRVAPLAFPVLR